ncbi:putative nuclease of restriction endonuclease-like (RecB) superfamily [Marinobacter sp. LV10R520-4]|uniref:PDDEXK nuclease domain-containing protein n=1 Tax=Marinobacter sp. LV10R520-4 TaxID=1761796 RepID=UPI000BF40F86|nr:PDDEXK nuclease domain-containing protein [Marinobacter sp. LV10R520-4]PFG52093.1 putative nuclease of restriction endonuclease-like (RecB) superfamily [Marinobacter sp. LV10R520-4]
MNQPSHTNLTGLVEPIAQIIEQARGQVRQAVNSVMVHSYWHIGQMIVEHEQQGASRAEYGKQQLQQLSAQLTQRLGKGFDIRNLRNMRAFYQGFPIRDALRTESVKDYLRDPYILDFLNLQDKTYQESELEQAIISNIQQFLLELGKGFAFVERQQRIRFADEACFKGVSYIDLVFYNFKLKCFLLVDLKLGKLKHQDVGQMDTYVRLYDEQHKGADDNPTVGLVLCSEKSEVVVKYSVLSEQKQLFSAKYLPYLPTEEQLKHELERERANVIAQLTARKNDDE